MESHLDHNLKGKEARTMKKWLLVSALAALCVTAGIAIGILVQSPATASNAVAVDPPPDGSASATATGTTEYRPTRTAGSGCGSSGCGQTARRGCCGSGGGRSAGAVDPAQRNEQLRASLTDTFTKSLGPGVVVEIKDFGCHQEAEVTQNGKLIKRLSISGGAVNDIT